MVLADLHRGSGETFLPKAIGELQTGLEKVDSLQGKKLEFSAVDVYGSASSAHIYGSTNLLLDSDAAINIFSSPKFGLALQSPVHGMGRDVLQVQTSMSQGLKEQHFPPASGAARASSSSFIRFGQISLLRHKKPNSPWLTRK